MDANSLFSIFHRNKKNARDDFYNSHLKAVHQKLLVHPVASTYLNGVGIQLNGTTLTSTTTFQVGSENLTTKKFAELFSIFDNSKIEIEQTSEMSDDGAPEGVYVKSTGKLIAQGHRNRSGVYKKRKKFIFLLEAFFIDHMFVDKNLSPPLLGTVAFALCAINAYQCNLSTIRLLAAGGIDRHRGQHFKPIYYGYKVWPKFGFDARLRWYERMNRRFWRCRTVQNVRKIDSGWWEMNGFQRFMEFDLSPSSTSWKIMLDYLSPRI